MLLKLPKHIRSSILQLRHERRNALINVYPIERQSINDYFQNLNLENGNSDTRHPMSYEWFRFGSYARYPENAPVRPIRLSAAGFFATGNGDEVKCFSCGVTYSNWLADDEAINVHRRISPHCEFVCNFDANIPISQPLNERSENNVLHGDSATAQRSEHSIENVTNLQRESYPSNTQNTSLSEHNTYDQIVRENETCTNHIQQNVDHPQSNVQNCHSNVVPPMVVERLDPLGINFQKPKYPSYAVLATRIRTYENWPENLTQKPKEMALAGFLYIGELDYCRCFFCGGGLRHWEAGDDPWVEHARWFPKCYFLRQNKEVQCTNNTEVSPTNGHHIVDEKNDDLSDEEFNLPSTLSVLQMGYSKDQVKQAISILKKTQNENPLTGSDILSTIFAIENGDFSTNKTDTNQEDEVLQENKRLKEQKLCRICKEEDANIAFLPCGHLLCCSDCAPAMRYCPSCQEYVRGTVKTWLV
ncbi:hypothetical protein KUTeg_000872 [Tegillarca granosa]|uniref:RING-type domain-containing protein n=1 Tax=Tegillarca granosa TaxID=220873 RepID=A0ABQ9FZK3_TEGGR|nr:hypothetical protein KUTeg_000872 [Tegillarca granosa]